MNDKKRIYHVAIFPSTRLSPYAFAGKNAARDAHRLASRSHGKVRVMTGQEWRELAAS
jgi:hypothetical protein